MFGKNLKRELYFVLFPLIALFILVFSGCENTTQSTSNIGNVSGRLTGIYNMPLPGVFVSAGNVSTRTDNYGRFSLSGVGYPYRLLILDSLEKKCILIPQRDNVTTNSLMINYLSTAMGYASSLISLSYPISVFTSGGKSFFTDFGDKNYPGDIMLSGSTIYIAMIPGTQYKGSVVILAYTKDANDRIVSYDKYAVRENVIINAGSVVNLEFPSEDFKTNLKDTVFHIAIDAGPGQNVNLRYAYLTCGSKHTTNYVNYVSQENISSNTFDIVVPKGIALTSNVIIGFNSTGPGAGTGSTGVYFPATGNKNVSAPLIPVLVSPEDNAIIGANSELVFNQGLNHVENRFYKLVLNDAGTGNQLYTNIEIYLDRERFNLSELNNLGIESVNGRIFNWYVEMFENMTLNDYISDIAGNTKLSSYSSARRFSVSP